MTNPTDDDLMQEALALLSQNPPTAAELSMPEPASEFDDENPTSRPDPLGEAPAPLTTSAAPILIGPPSAASPTLAALEASRHPQQKTACETCPNSVWFSSPEEVKCYCRVMYLVAWSSQAPNQITHCDGLYLGQEEA
jgi:hypothetical protein